MGHDRHDERRQDQDGGAGERGGDALRERLPRPVGAGSGGGEDGDQDAEAERAAEVVGDVDDPGETMTIETSSTAMA